MNVKKLLEALKLPSPLEEVSTSWSKKAEIQLFIKRDDLIHPYISGNKWRKLSGILRAFEGQFTEVVTYGGPYSNHLLATASCCELLGIPSIGYVRGERPTKLNTMLGLCQNMGMNITFLDRPTFRSEKLTGGIQENQLFIPEGGAMPEGTEGCKEIWEEMDQDLDHFFVASGTGTSLAGLCSAMDKEHTLLHAVPVLKGGQFIAEEVRRLNGCSSFELHTKYHFGGYAKTTPELFDLVTEFALETGVLLDPIYTAKLMWAVRDQAGQGNFSSGARVGLLHSGGLSGWYGKWPNMIQQKSPLE